VGNSFLAGPNSGYLSGANADPDEYSSEMPEEVAAGDTIEFERTFGDFDPADGWACTIEVHNATERLAAVAATAGTGEDFRFVIPKATTAAWAAGRVDWAVYADDGTERHRVYWGHSTIVADLETVDGFDGRTHAKKVLDAIEAVIEGRATKDQQSYTIRDRALSRTPIGDLLMLRQTYLAAVEDEHRAEQIAHGKGGHRGRIRTRFRSR
jgi:hypothetical protein